MGYFDHLPSLSDALQTASAEYNTVSKMVASVDSQTPGATPSTPATGTDPASKVNRLPLQKSTAAVPTSTANNVAQDIDERDDGEQAEPGMLDSISNTMSSMLSSGGDLMSTVKDLTSVDVNVNAGGKVDLDTTVTFAVDRNSIIYSALASFVAMELYHYFNR